MSVCRHVSKAKLLNELSMEVNLYVMPLEVATNFNFSVKVCPRITGRVLTWCKFFASFAVRYSRTNFKFAITSSRKNATLE